MAHLFRFLVEYAAVVMLTLAVSAFVGSVLSVHLQMFLEHVFGPITHALGAAISWRDAQHALA